MRPFERDKVITLLPPQLKDDGDFAGNTYVDTAGFDEKLRVEFHVGTVDAAIGSTTEATPPLIEECNTTDGSYTAVTDAALAAVFAATGDDKIRAIDVSLKKTHKRYMRVQAPHAGNGTTGCNLCIIGRLSGGHVIKNAADQGLTELVEA
ncbi:MAG: hypothetical protein MUP16_10045 [Sedimentisphaerales bacterium]|nr:hypothetical protein [Sedimentisphaerales bacterium]